MTKEIISTPLAPQAIGTYSQAIKVDHTVYLSGQIPLVPETMTIITGDISAQITQVFDNHLKRFYVAKIRGVIVGNEGEYKHETPEAAQSYGKEIQARWRAEFTATNTACTGRDYAVS